MRGRTGEEEGGEGGQSAALQTWEEGDGQKGVEQGRKEEPKIDDGIGISADNGL